LLWLNHLIVETDDEYPSIADNFVPKRGKRQKWPVRGSSNRHKQTTL